MTFGAPMYVFTRYHDQGRETNHNQGQETNQDQTREPQTVVFVIDKPVPFVEEFDLLKWAPVPEKRNKS